MTKPYPHLCPECGKISVYQELADHVHYSHDGLPCDFVIHDTPVNKCTECQATWIPRDTLDLLTEKCREHSGLLTASYMKDRMKQLKLTDMDLSSFVCVSVNVIQSWLDNVSVQDKVSDNLLREILA